MKVEQLDRFSPVVGSQKYSCYEYYPKTDILYTGTICGKLYLFDLYRRLNIRNLKPDEISKDASHHGAITCLVFTTHSALVPPKCQGILVSGSSDRTVKLWNPESKNNKCLQTLTEHEGTITSLCDGGDGTLLSSSVDGTVRVWRPQRGRKGVPHPVLECSFVIRSVGGEWLSAMAVSSINSWVCYIGDMNGTIEIYKKGSDSLTSEVANAIYTGQLTRHKRWERVHALGITSLQIVYSESFLISISNSCQVKVLQMYNGTLLYTINNSRNCLYTSVLWDVKLNGFYLCDESGHLEVWSCFHERKTEEMIIVAPSVTAHHAPPATIGRHHVPLISALTRYTKSGEYMILLPSDGYVALIALTIESACMEFAGHDGYLVLELAVLPPAQTREPSRDKSLQYMTGDEMAFFSVGEDGTVRCWDEYDAAERYMLKSKLADISVAHMIWDLHVLATGHEDGVVCLWNVDTGAKVISRAMSGNAISAMTSGRSKTGDEVLMAADRDGHCFVWNLALFRVSPLQLVVDFTCNGWHDPEEPGILCLSFHEPSGCFLSGGSDGTIRCWRLKTDVEPVTLTYHDDNPVWNMCTTEQFLLSGDDTGAYVLWLLTVPANTARRFISLPLAATVMCRWDTGTPGSLQPLSLQQTVMDTVHVAIVNQRTGQSSAIWVVSIDETTTATSLAEMTEGPLDLKTDWSSIAVKGNDDIAATADTIESDSKTKYFSMIQRFHENFPLGTRISAHRMAVSSHESLEPSCMELRLQRVGGGREGTTECMNMNLYIGSANGIIQKFTIKDV